MSTILDLSTEILQEKTEKIIPENIRKGVRIFDIDGALEAGAATEGIKQFATIEEMNADTTAKVGDLAMVYKNETKNAGVDSKFRSATFPATVTLSIAFTNYADIMYRATDSSAMFECWGQLDQSYFMMDCYTEAGSIRIQYESSDGLTYTRVDGGEEVVDFGTEIYYAYPDYWNDAIGCFIQIGSKEFNGLYERIEILNKEYIRFADLRNMTFNIENDAISSWNWDGTFIPGYYDLNKINTLIKQYSVDKGYSVYSINNIGLYLNTEGKVFFIVNLDRNNNFNNASLAGDMNGNIIGLCIYKTTTPSMVTLDLDNMTYKEEILSLDSSKSHKTYFRTYYLIDILPISYPPRFYPSTSDAGHLAMTMDAYYSTWNGADGDENETAAPHNVNECYKKEYLYSLASTQLSATSDSVYNSIFYGKDGVEEGSLGNANDTFSDTSAAVYSKVLSVYENMTPVILNDTNYNTLNKSMYLIPKKSDGTPLINTRLVSNMSNMFRDFNNLTQIEIDSSNSTNTYGIFYSCANLQKVSNLNTYKSVSLSMAFTDCTNLESVTGLNTSNITGAMQAFLNCSNLRYLPDLELISSPNICGMFRGCSNLSQINISSNSNPTHLAQTFFDCSNLTSLPLFDTSNVTNANTMFRGCTNLIDVPQYNFSKVTDVDWIAMGCNNLSNASIHNIINMCLNSAVTNTQMMNFNNTNLSGPFRGSNINSSRYSNRLSEITSKGWKY